MSKKEEIKEDLIININEIEIEGKEKYSNESFNINKNENNKENTIENKQENTDENIKNDSENSSTRLDKDNDIDYVDDSIDNEFDYEEKKENKLIDKLKKKNTIITLVATLSVSAIGVKGYNIYKEIKEEQIRLSELDKENLDLKLIINTVDKIGKNKYQLNWKEVASILAVEKNNRPEEITKDDIERVSLMFIDKENKKVRTLSEVVSTLELKDKEIERIFNYKEDLSEHGYVPEKLTSNSEQMNFINSIKPGAIESYKKTGILPSITIAQAILESNWGQSNLTKEANNLFGIKADNNWDGEFVVFETKEYHNTIIKDKFRKYKTLNDSVKDHSEFLYSNPRYKKGGVFKAKTYKKQALALQKAGYSTAEDANGKKIYAKMLGELIRQYNLQLIDWEVKHNN